MNMYRMTANESARKETKPDDFFHTLYGGTENGHICIWTKNYRKSRWFETTDTGIEEASTYAISMAEEDDVYFGVCLQKEALGDYQRGSTDSALFCPGIWVDIDIAGDAHSAGNLPSNNEDVQRIMEQFSLEPTVIVNSGHGYHVYTLFDKPFMIMNEKERNRIQDLVNSYQKILRSYCTKKGWTLDNTSDLARILRVPGTMNHKSNPVPVLVTSQSNKRYPFEMVEDAVLHIQEQDADHDLDTFTEPIYYPEIIKTEGKNTEDFGKYNEADLNLVIKRCSVIRHSVEDADKLTEPEWYAFITVASRCINGRELVHEYSKPHPGYDPAETDAKIAHSLEDTGPMTCRKISGESWGIFCSECPYRHFATSPISLGYNSAELETVDSAIEIRDMVSEIEENPEKSPLVFKELQKNENRINALALLHNIEPTIFERIINTIRDAGYVKKTEVEEFRRLVKKVARKIGERNISFAPEPVPLSEICPGMPSSDTLVVPPGWIINEEGIFKETLSAGGYADGERELKEVSASPIITTQRLRDIENDSEVLEVKYLRDGKWKPVYLPREDMMQAKNLVPYSKYGFPVNSINARDMVDFFQNLEKWNITRLPKQLVSHKLGWVGEEKSGFLLGDQFINTSGEIINDDSDKGSEEKVLFSPESYEYGSISEAFHPEGSYETWVEAVSMVKDFPVAMLIFYSSFVPPLLGLMKIPNFVIDLAYRTSSGKTTLQRLAASVYGCPDENSQQTVILNWDSTRVYLERVSAMLNGLPMILNDSKQATNGKVIEQVIYDVTNGRTRGRGNKRGVDRTENIRTVLLSSGESPLVFSSESGGTRTRVITVNIAPFHGADGDTAAIVNGLNRTIRSNYGHAGSRYIQHLIRKHREYSTVWDEIFMEHKEDYRAKAKGDAFINRLSDYFAAIDLAGILAHDALDLPWEFDSPIFKIWDDITRESKAADRCIEAMELFYTYCASRRHLFWDGIGSVHAATDFFGIWESDDRWTSFGVERSRINSILEDLGYDSPKTILSEWKDRNFLIAPSKGRCTKRVRCNGNDIPCVFIRRDKLEELKIIGSKEEESKAIEVMDTIPERTKDTYSNMNPVVFEFDPDLM